MDGRKLAEEGMDLKDVLKVVVGGAVVTEGRGGEFVLGARVWVIGAKVDGNNSGGVENEGNNNDRYDGRRSRIRYIHGSERGSLRRTVSDKGSIQTNKNVV